MEFLYLITMVTLMQMMIVDNDEDRYDDDDDDDNDEDLCLDYASLQSIRTLSALIIYLLL